MKIILTSTGFSAATSDKPPLTGNNTPLDYLTTFLHYADVMLTGSLPFKEIHSAPLNLRFELRSNINRYDGSIYYYVVETRAAGDSLDFDGDLYLYDDWKAYLIGNDPNVIAEWYIEHGDAPDISDKAIGHLEKRDFVLVTLWFFDHAIREIKAATQTTVETFIIKRD